MTENLVDKYRKKIKTEVVVQVPTGFKFTIRKLNPLALSKLSEDLDITNLNEGDTTTNRNLTIRMLKAAIIEPQITENDVGDENALSILELDGDDVMFLIDEIIKSSGAKTTEV